MKRSVLAIFIALGLSGCAATDDDIEVSASQVPANVMEAARNAVIGMRIVSIEKEIEDGKVVYEFDGFRKGLAYEIDISEQGEVLEIERETLPDKSESSFSD